MNESDATDRRTIEIDVEVPGTPQEVWDAIATGTGITAWFVPATVEPRQGGEITLHFGEGIAETGRVTTWDPPRRFVYETSALDDRLAQEFLVEARDSGTCIVRFVNSGFGTGADWDNQYDSMSEGWKLFFDNLRLYLTHFAGQPCSSITETRVVDAPRDEVWAALTKELGLPDAPAVGAKVAAEGPGVPPLAGTVDRVRDGMVTVLLDEPAPGIGEVMADAMADQVYVSVYLYLYGDGAPSVVDRDRPAWTAWLDARYPNRFPPPP